MSRGSLTTAGDLRVELLAERGLDIGAAEWRGIPFHWSRIPSTVATKSWLSDWPGGLVTTCGLNNVGVPSEGYGLHGDFALTPATDVVVDVDADGMITASGTVVDGSFSCARTVAVHPSGLLRIDDVVTNTASERLQAPLLYHVNFGAPFFGPKLEVIANIERTTPRDPESRVVRGDWRQPASVQRDHEVVLEHVLADSVAKSITLINRAEWLKVVVGWHGLDRVHQWIDLADDRGVLAIEPANCTVLGRGADRLAGAPYLDGGASRSTGVSVEVSAP